MKMKITASTEVDFSPERQRISRAFRKDPETMAKLNQLMDLVEAQKWNEALKELEGEWWQGQDRRQECSRLEFVGLVKSDMNLFSHGCSIIELIVTMAGNPAYKVVSTSGS